VCLFIFLFLSLSPSLPLTARVGKEIFQSSFLAKEMGPEPFLLIRGSKVGPMGFGNRPRAPEHSGSKPSTDQGFEGWPLDRVRQPPQSIESGVP
jgi:hypothetical protein